MIGPEVTQADREAAAKCHEKSCYEIVRIQGVQCRNGYADGDYLVQAFARHRTAATEPLEAQIAMLVRQRDELVEALEVAREALKPFAFAAEHAPKIAKPPHAFVTTSEFIAARAALAKHAAMKGEQ
jgi:hypothetical protein